MSSSTNIQEKKDQSDEAIPKETLDAMKEELYYIVEKYSSKKNIEGSTYQMFLCNNHPIEFDLKKMDKLNNFLRLVEYNWDRFAVLLGNLSYASLTVSKTSDRIIGPIDFSRTFASNGYHKERKFTCIVNSKNFFTPENILFAAIIFDIQTVANNFFREYAIL